MRQPSVRRSTDGSSPEPEVESSQPVTGRDLEDFCRKHWLLVYRIIYRRCGSKAEAEELTQDVFLRAIKSFHSNLESELPSIGYLIRIAQNLTVDLWRSQSRNPPAGPIGIDPVATAPGPESSMLAIEQRDMLLIALDRLPDRYSEVLRLRLQEGRSAVEVASLLNMTPNAVRQLQFRAVDALRHHMDYFEEQSS